MENSKIQMKSVLLAVAVISAVAMVSSPFASAMGKSSSSSGGPQMSNNNQGNQASGGSSFGSFFSGATGGSGHMGAPSAGGSGQSGAPSFGGSGQSGAPSSGGSGQSGAPSFGGSGQSGAPSFGGSSGSGGFPGISGISGISAPSGVAGAGPDISACLKSNGIDFEGIAAGFQSCAQTLVSQVSQAQDPSHVTAASITDSVKHCQPSLPSQAQMQAAIQSCLKSVVPSQGSAK